MTEEKTWYVMSPIPIEMEDAITHTEANGFECGDPNCICHWEQATHNEADLYGTHAPDCRCSWCSSEE